MLLLKLGSELQNLVKKLKILRGGGGLPCTFLKIEKQCPDPAKKFPNFGKTCPVCVHL